MAEQPKDRSQKVATDEDDRHRILVEIIRFGTLAPSSHNTQCWKFQILEVDDDNGDTGKTSAIVIHPDFTRRCKVVDPDDHHMFVSLGCAIENMILAALAHGLRAEIVDLSNPKKNGIRLHFTPCEKDITPLFEAIPKRQCTRNLYDGTHLSEEELEALRRAGTGDGVRVLLLTEKTSVSTVLDYVTKANTVQFTDSQFMDELKAWIRFNGKEANAMGDGLYSASTGNPSVPRWLGNIIFNLVARAGPENEKIMRQVESSAGIAVFVSEVDDARHWVEAGRCYERFALQATVMGVKNAMLNQPVEVTDIRPDFARAMNIDKASRPDLVVRFGMGSEMPRSYRRQVQDVLI